MSDCCMHCAAPEPLELEEGLCCEACAEERDAGDHDAACDCEACQRISARSSTAPHRGGLSGWGKHLLGLGMEEAMQKWFPSSWSYEHPAHGWFHVDVDLITGECTIARTAASHEPIGKASGLAEAFAQVQARIRQLDAAEERAA